MNAEPLSCKRDREYWNAQAPKPSQYLHHLEALLAGRETPLPVVLYCRVSTREQECEGNLQTQVTWATARLEQLNVELLATYTEVIGAYPAKGAQEKLYDAAREWQRLGAVLVAPCTDRFVRNDRWWDTGGDGGGCLPSAADFDELRMWTLGVPLATIYHPDEDVNGSRVNWGGKAGRPRKPERKKDRRERLLPTVLAMHWDGKPKAAIARELGVSRTTVRRWIENGE